LGFCLVGKTNYANLYKFNAEQDFHIRSLKTKLGIAEFNDKSTI